MPKTVLNFGQGRLQLLGTISEVSRFLRINWLSVLLSTGMICSRHMQMEIIKIMLILLKIVLMLLQVMIKKFCLMGRKIIMDTVNILILKEIGKHFTILPIK